MINGVKEGDIDYIVHGDQKKAQELIGKIGYAAQKIVGVITTPNNLGDMRVFFENKSGILTRADISIKGYTTKYNSGAWLAEDNSTPKDIQDRIKLILKERKNENEIHYIQEAV